MTRIVTRLLRLHETGIEWLHQRLTKKQFLIVSSVLVGLTAGMAAVVLKTCVHFIHNFVNQDHSSPFHFLLYLALPGIGIILTVLFFKKVIKQDANKGSAFILQSIAKKNSKLPPHMMFSHLVTSAVTVGFGGSAGLESPIVTTGSAIGSNYGNTYHLTYKDRTLLLACGAAAGIGAAFNAPIAGLLFALEVLLADVAVSAFIPIMIAAAAGTLVSKIILHDDIVLSLRMSQGFDYHNTHWYVLLGLLAGIVSVYYSRMFVRVEQWFRKIKLYRNKVLFAGISLAALLALFPALYGEGYSGITSLASEHPESLFNNSIVKSWITSPWILLALLGITMLIKVFATGFTLAGGGNGGNFAPSLFVGSYLGFCLSQLINLSGIAKLPISNFTIVGMAGILTGIFHAPLTGIFLIAEVTGGYELMIPLMIVSSLSYLIVKYFEPYSMDTKHLASRGHIFTHDRDRNVLSKMKVERLLETDFQPLAAEMKLGDLVSIITTSHRSTFPVINAAGELLGLVHMDKIRSVMFKSELYDSADILQFMSIPAATIDMDEDMISVMQKFDETQAWNLPVLQRGLYKGFISKSGVFTRYRKVLTNQTINPV